MAWLLVKSGKDERRERGDSGHTVFRVSEMYYWVSVNDIKGPTI